MAGRSQSVVRRTAASFLVLALAFGSGTTVALADDGALRRSEWALTALKAEQAWKTTKGKGVTVAVVGTGVDATHPDLRGRMVKGADFTDGSSDAASRDQGKEGQTLGTHMAGIIAGTGGNFRGDGIFGLAPEAKIMPLRVYRNETADVTATARAIRYAADKGAQVIDVTIAFTRQNDTLKAAVAAAQKKGAVIVAGVGDTGDTGNVPTYPAAYPDVIGVTATDDKGAVWQNAHSGKAVDLAAPGVEILTTAPNGDYWTGQGTAYAAAWVSASAALLRAEHPRWTADQIVRKLTATATDGGAKGTDAGYGHGIVAPAAALVDRAAPSATGPATADREQAVGGTEGVAMLTVSIVTGVLVLAAIVAWFLISRSRSKNEKNG